MNGAGSGELVLNVEGEMALRFVGVVGVGLRERDSGVFVVETDTERDLRRAFESKKLMFSPTRNFIPSRPRIFSPTSGR